MPALSDPLPMPHGPAWPNRVALAPLTNLQSNPDGRLSDDEFNWLTRRAEGGFGLVMTCAAHVRADGQGFPGQLGVWDDRHLPGLARLAAALKAAGAVSAVQLQHSGARADPKLTGQPLVGPFDDPDSGATALPTAGVEALRDAFIKAAGRAEAAGFDGVELHAAHGYLLCAFLDAERNRRGDRYGGSLANRARLLFEIADGIRSCCRADFQLGIRLSPERFGVPLADAKALAADILMDPRFDWLDMSLWDIMKAPEEAAHAGARLIDSFAGLPRRGCRLGVAGRILTAARAREAIETGADFVLIGRGAILHQDWAARAIADPAFEARPLPVSRATLAAEGLGPAFIDYMAGWKGFVAEVA